MDTSNELKIISICSGSLGIERGIARSGTKIRTVAHVEREAFICYNLVKQMEQGMVDEAPIWTDVKTFDAKPFRNRVHGIIGGYPCQGESSAGNRELMDYEGFLWPNIEQQIIDSNPLFCFFENVGAHLSGSFSYILSRLRHLGYQVEAGLFTAAETGAPHKRERVFILAWADTNELRECLANASSFQGNLQHQPRRSNSVTTCEGCTALANSHRHARNDERGIATEENGSTPWAKPSGEDSAIAVLPNTTCQRRCKAHQQHPAAIAHHNGSQWPAPPGRQQHWYEEPRVTGGGKTESGMGCSINGYDFRSDLLRMYGNGVVEQEAEIAWTTLTRKALAIR